MVPLRKTGGKKMVPFIEKQKWDKLFEKIKPG